MWESAALFGSLLLMYLLAGLALAKGSPKCRWFANGSLGIFSAFAIARLLGWTSLPWWQVFAPVWFPLGILGGLALLEAGCASGSYAKDALTIIIWSYTRRWWKAPPRAA